MTILEAIQAANSAADVKTFRFATISDSKAFFSSFNLDDLNYTDMPVHIVEPFEIPFTFQDPLRKSVVQIRGWFLRRIAEDTNDFREISVETQYLQPTRALCFKYLKHLIRSEIVDPGEDAPDPSGSVKPEYAFLNIHSFGVSYVINLPIVQSVC